MSSSSFLGGLGGNPYTTYQNPGNLTTKGGLGSALGTLFNQNQQQQASTQAQRNTEGGTALSGYQGLVNSGGYSPTEQANIEQGTLGGSNSAYNSAAAAAQNHAAVTHNAAGYNSFMGSLARGKAQAASQGALQVQSSFADQAYQRKLQGLQGLSQMYGVDTNFLSALNQNQSQLLGVGSNVSSTRRGVLSSILAPVEAVGSLLHGGSNNNQN